MNNKFWGWKNPLWSWLSAGVCVALGLYFTYLVAAFAIPNGHFFAALLGTTFVVWIGWVAYMWADAAWKLTKLSKDDGRYPDPHFINDPKLYTLAEFVAQYKEDLDAYQSDLDSEGVKGQKLTYYDWCRRYANFMSWADR